MGVRLIEGMATFSCGSYFLLKQAESNRRCSKNIVKFLPRSECLVSAASSQFSEYRMLWVILQGDIGVHMDEFKEKQLLKKNCNSVLKMEIA